MFGRPAIGFTAAMNTCGYPAAGCTSAVDTTGRPTDGSNAGRIGITSGVIGSAKL
jgi:hypothetical protein